MLSLEELLDTLPLSDKEESSLKYSKGARRRGDGFRYEELVIVLVFLRCLRKRLPHFEVTFDNSHAGKFDDVVVTWIETRVRHSLLVQVKHRSSKDSEAVRIGELFSSSDNNKSDFNIWKYHKSFRKFKKHLSGDHYALVISTNAALHYNALARFRERRIDSVLGAELIEAGGRLFELDPKASKFDPDFMKHFFVFCSQKGVDGLRVDICAELEHLLGPPGRYDDLCEELCSSVMEWKDTLCNNAGTLDSSWTKWRDIVRRHKVGELSDCSDSTTGPKLHSGKDVPRQVQRVNILRSSPVSADRAVWEVAPRDTRDSLYCSKTQWKDADIKQSVNKVTDCNALTTRLKFRSVGIIRDYVQRTNPAYVRPLSADTMALSIAKIHQAIHPETHIVMNVKRFREAQQTVVRWWGPFCKWLVLVDDDAEEQRHFSHLLKKVRQQIDDCHRLVLVSMKNVTSFQDSYCCSDVSDESWDGLLSTKIRLNGDEHICQLSNLVSSREVLQIIFKDRPSCLVTLARNSDYVKLGQSLDPLPASYVPRELVTRRYVKDEFFSTLSVRDVCVIDNGTYQKFTEKVSHHLKHYKECMLKELEEHLALHSSAPTLAKADKVDIIALEHMCRKYKGLYVYIVKYTEYGWCVQSLNAGSGRIRHYSREQRVQLLEALDVSNNKVIVEGSPGVGKSTALLALAREVKRSNPSTWVVRVNLREIYEKLEKAMSGEEVGELILQSVVTSEGVWAELEFMLLSHCLQEQKHMVCLVDSFDEVEPDYTKECIQALRLLSPRRGKLVVASRPAAARLLEDHLGLLAYSLPVFSNRQLRMYFDGLRARVPRMRIDSFTEPLGDLLRTPLFAEMYKHLLEFGTGLYNTLSLYEAFFHYKFAKMYVANFGDTFSDPGKSKEVKQLWRSHETKLKNLACEYLVKNTNLFRKPVLMSGDKKLMKGGVVHQFTGRKSLFRHRTFAEYFLAKWCFLDASQKALTTVYSSAHTEKRLEFFLEVFDHMASGGRPLLTAVLEGDKRRVRVLLKTGVGVEERDAWGRSALHLAAAHGAEASLLRALCERMRASLVERDGLVHWTPLQYAARRGHWSAVEALLQAGADLNQLGNIQVAVALLLLKNSLRVNSLVENLLVRIAEEYGHSKVLKMLWEIYNNAERRHMNVDSELSKDLKDCKKKCRNRKPERHTAIQCGYEEKVSKLVMRGADLNVQDENGAATPHWAAHFNRVKCIKLLTDAGSELEGQDGNGLTALHYAAKAGSSDVLKLLTEAGAHLEARDKDGRTALHYATRLASTECARLLVKAGAEADVRDTFGATPLHYAAEENTVDIARVLIEAGADLEACDGDGMSALHYAALQARADCTRLLLRAGASVHRQDNVGATPLHYAVEANAADVSGILLDAGARLHKCDADGMTALHYAADNGSAECASQLVIIGASVNLRDKFGATPLHYVVKTNDSCIAKLLINAGAYLQVRDTHGKTALHYAAHHSSLECASLLVSAGANGNVSDNFGATPLHYAAEENAAALVKLLTEPSARLRSCNEDGVTGLQCAASGGSAKGAPPLITHIASVNAPDKVGATPLHYAARARNTECVDVHVRDEAVKTALDSSASVHNSERTSFPISAGTSVKVRDGKGAATLLDAAMSDCTIPCRLDRFVAGEAECISLLLASGAHPDTQDEWGKTALHYAVSAGNVAGAGLLIDAGADVLATDKRGETALHCAVKSDRSRCFTLLLRSIATNSLC